MERYKPVDTKTQILGTPNSAKTQIFGSMKTPEGKPQVRQPERVATPVAPQTTHELTDTPAGVLDLETLANDSNKGINRAELGLQQAPAPPPTASKKQKWNYAIARELSPAEIAVMEALQKNLGIKPKTQETAPQPTVILPEGPLTPTDKKISDLKQTEAGLMNLLAAS